MTATDLSNPPTTSKKAAHKLAEVVREDKYLVEPTAFIVARTDYLPIDKSRFAARPRSHLSPRELRRLRSRALGLASLTHLRVDGREHLAHCAP